MRRRAAVLSVVGVVVAAAAVASVLIYQRHASGEQRKKVENQGIAASRRVSVGVDALLLRDGSHIPVWHGAGWSVDAASYPVPGDPVTGIARRWKGWASAELRQHVLKFDTPLQAAEYYRSHEPEAAFTDDYPGYVRNESSRYKSKFADASQLVCGNRGKSKSGDLEACTLWSLWVRYGQYDMEIALNTDDHGMALGELLPYVQLFDATAGRRLATK
jgi:hypothetical protein